MTEETQYEIEDAKSSGFRDFIAKRWVRITAISVAAAIALVGAFGVGVVAGERMAGNGGGAFGPYGTKTCVARQFHFCGCYRCGGNQSSGGDKDFVLSR